MKRTAILVVAALLCLSAPLASSGCGATVATNPTQTQIQQTRVTAIRVADEITRAIDIAHQVTTTCQGLVKSAAHPDYPIDNATIIKIDQAGILAGQKLKDALEDAKQATDNPSLARSAKVAVTAVDDFIGALPNPPDAVKIGLAILKGSLTLTRAQ